MDRVVTTGAAGPLVSSRDNFMCQGRGIWAAELRGRETGQACIYSCPCLMGANSDLPAPITRTYFVAVQ